MKIEPATPGWLDSDFHHHFRELLLHASTRESLFCPAYCLMPDHLHLMWMGMSRNSNQLNAVRNAVRFLRTHLNRLLGGSALENRQSPDSQIRRRGAGDKWILQPQAYDHKLRESERKRNAFTKVCFYILANPVRAQFTQLEQDWPFSGAIVPGYPSLYPFHEDFWELFWKLYQQHREEAATASG